jgi:hypothetical protein
MIILIMSPEFSVESVNETAMQNVWQHRFLQPGEGGGGGMWDTFSCRGVGHSKTSEM